MYLLMCQVCRARFCSFTGNCSNTRQFITQFQHETVYYSTLTVEENACFLTLVYFANPKYLIFRCYKMKTE